MDIHRIRYFIAVCDAGSLRRASETVFITPPALSKAIKTLESELGVKLLAPYGRAIRVTDSGLELARRMRPVLEQMSRIKDELKNRVFDDKPVQLGSFEIFTTHFLGPLMRDALAGQSIVLQELVPGHIERALIRKDIDIAITYLPIPSSELDHVKAASVELAIYARHDCFVGLPFRMIPFVIPVQPLDGSPTIAQGLDGWPDNMIHRNVRFRVALMESALELCRQGLAAAYLPSFVARLHNEKVSARFQLRKLRRPKEVGSARQSVYLVKRKSDLESRILRKIAEVIRRVCR